MFTCPTPSKRTDVHYQGAVRSTCVPWLLTDECSSPGASVASIALAHGLNANLVHKWRREARDVKVSDDAAEQAAFVPVTLTAPMPAPRADVRIELRRGPVSVNVEWPLSGTVPAHEIAANWPSIVNLLAGSLVGAWLGAGWATKLSNRRLYQVISITLLAIAVVLVFAHGVHSDGALLRGPAQVVTGLVAGFVFGVVAAVMGVAGGELLIPTLILLFGADIKLAGSLSVAISLPTMVVGFVRFSRDSAFEVLRHNRRFVLAMAVGSVVGVAVGGQLLGVVPHNVLLPALAAILVISAVKVWRHK
ncbi:TSUP family transporter [Ideonella sp. DXS29W]|uniref:Probable membrane transporter protein n=1 Tax=Ideonella lacteola TaxID=2984193 RepID=A0ABU9C0A0_9BURK